MKVFLAFALATCFAFSGFTAETPNNANALRHVVILKFKPGTSADRIKQVETDFRALKDKIPQVVSLEWGTNVSTENRSKGFTHLFFLTFKSDADLKTYLKHPAHKAFTSTLPPVMDDAFVFDYWAQN